MTRHFGLLAMLAAALLAMPSSGNAASAAQEGVNSVRFFIGTWNCAHRVGDFAGTYTTTYVATLGDSWLKQTYDFPATQKDPAVQAEYFLRYDERIARWVRFGAHSNGMYFGMYSKSPADTTTWQYSYVMPGGAGEATWTKKSETEYTVDGPSYPENEKTVTEHHDCKKA